MGALTQGTGCFDTRKSKANVQTTLPGKAISASRKSPNIFKYTSTHRACVFLKGKQVAQKPVHSGVHSRMDPNIRSIHRKSFAGLTSFPPILSGLPPDPVPPLRLQC